MLNVVTIPGLLRRSSRSRPSIGTVGPTHTQGRDVRVHGSDRWLVARVCRVRGLGNAHVVKPVVKLSVQRAGGAARTLPVVVARSEEASGRDEMSDVAVGVAIAVFSSIVGTLGKQLLRLLTQAAQGNAALFCFLAADDEDQRYSGLDMLTDFVADLLVARIALDP